MSSESTGTVRSETPVGPTHPEVADEPARPNEHPVDGAKSEVVIRPRRGWIGLDFAEMARYRELLYFLVWRDVKVRYKQTVLGVAWAVLQPLFAMLIFTIIFGKLAGIDSESFPYAVFVYAGLLPWTFFQTGVNLAGLSLVNQQQLLTKIYFPRLFVPTASIGAGLIDLVISFGVYVCIIAFYSLGPDWTFAPSWGLAALPPLVLLTIMAALGFGYLLAALTVSYRDFKYVIPFMLQSMMYLSPVIYPVSIVPERYQWILAINPMTGIIDGYRSAILGKDWNLPALIISAFVTATIFVFGLYYFRKTERRFADIA